MRWLVDKGCLTFLCISSLVACEDKSAPEAAPAPPASRASAKPAAAEPAPLKLKLAPLTDDQAAFLWWYKGALHRLSAASDKSEVLGRLEALTSMGEHQVATNRKQTKLFFVNEGKIAYLDVGQPEKMNTLPLKYPESAQITVFGLSPDDTWAAFELDGGWDNGIHAKFGPEDMGPKAGLHLVNLTTGAHTQMKGISEVWGFIDEGKIAYAVRNGQGTKTEVKALDLKTKKSETLFAYDDGEARPRGSRPQAGKLLFFQQSHPEYFKSKSKLIVSDLRGKNQKSLCVDPDGTTELASHELSNPALSPDGRHALVTASRGMGAKNEHLILIDIEKNTCRKVFTGYEAAHPRWLNSEVIITNYNLKALVLSIHGHELRPENINGLVPRF